MEGEQERAVGAVAVAVAARREERGVALGQPPQLPLDPVALRAGDEARLELDGGGEARLGAGDADGAGLREGGGPSLSGGGGSPSVGRQRHRAEQEGQEVSSASARIATSVGPGARPLGGQLREDAEADVRRREVVRLPPAPEVDLPGAAARHLDGPARELRARLLGADEVDAVRGVVEPARRARGRAVSASRDAANCDDSSVVTGTIEPLRIWPWQLGIWDVHECEGL